MVACTEEKKRRKKKIFHNASRSSLRTERESNLVFVRLVLEYMPVLHWAPARLGTLTRFKPYRAEQPTLYSTAVIIPLTYVRPAGLAHPSTETKVGKAVKGREPVSYTHLRAHET